MRGSTTSGFGREADISEGEIGYTSPKVPVCIGTTLIFDFALTALARPKDGYLFPLAHRAFEKGHRVERLKM